MSCSKISKCLVAFVPLNYQSPANFVSAGDYYFLLGKGPNHAQSQDILTWSRHFRTSKYPSEMHDLELIPQRGGGLIWPPGKKFKI